MHTAFFGPPNNSQVIRVQGAAAPRVFLTRITCSHALVYTLKCFSSNSFCIAAIAMKLYTYDMSYIKLYNYTVYCQYSIICKKDKGGDIKMMIYK